MSSAPVAMRPVPQAVLGWARRPGPRAVLLAARAKLESGASGGRVPLNVDLTEPDRRDVGRMLGLSWQSSGRPATLGVLRAVLAREGTDLESLLVIQGGALRDLKAERAGVAVARTERRGRLERALVGAGLDEAVIAVVLQRKLLGGLEDPATEELAAGVVAVLAVAPAGGVLLASLAQDVHGDPHALDRDRSLGRATCRVLAVSAAHEAGTRDEEELAAAADTPGHAAGWRTVWAAAGVLCDSVSSTVLALNVTLCGNGSAAAMLAASAGEPVWLTARALRGIGTGAERTPRLVIRVCENPSVIEAAADVLGAGCPPLVCTYGRPSTAAWLLLNALHAAGAQLLVSADRDVAGRSIQADLLERFPGSLPWLPEAEGLYEEERLPALLHEMAPASSPQS